MLLRPIGPIVVVVVVVVVIVVVAPIRPRWKHISGVEMKHILHYVHIAVLFSRSYTYLVHTSKVCMHLQGYILRRAPTACFDTGTTLSRRRSGAVSSSFESCCDDFALPLNTYTFKTRWLA